MFHDLASSASSLHTPDSSRSAVSGAFLLKLTLRQYLDENPTVTTRAEVAA
ncbi:hypothetical protein JYU34_016044 [Plutella xylostella]|uniref:Uncharacterized protein n=1 Tax=Plutella xylostella TaxID=51655 RepID=A0ABQ7Q5A2_PLUXY|nr:hypothetical protein JYU34_016044 [Plutella xylostella]